MAASNRLLARLPSPDRARMERACSIVDLKVGTILADAGNAIRHIYLPLTGYLSLLRPIDGEHIEVALAGNEGMFGCALTLHAPTSEVRVLVQGEGTSLKMTSGEFAGQMNGSAALRRIVGLYTSVLMSQYAQTAGCNRFHVVEKRLARWLLTTADRAQSPSFGVTHDFLSKMLGVRRAGVSEAAAKLSKLGHITCRRGGIFIRDRAALEATSCSCYRVNADTYDRALGRVQ